MDRARSNTALADRLPLGNVVTLKLIFATLIGIIAGINFNLFPG